MFVNRTMNPRVTVSEPWRCLCGCYAAMGDCAHAKWRWHAPAGHL